MCFNSSLERRVPSLNRYMAVASFCFCKNNKRTIIITSFLRHATIAPSELAFGKGLLILGSERGIGATSRATRATTGATRCARRWARRASTGVTAAAARASMVASRVVPSTRAAARASLGAARVALAHSEGTIRLGTRVPDDNVLHVIECKGVTSVDMSKKFLVSLLVPRCVREVESH